MASGLLAGIEFQQSNRSLQHFRPAIGGVDFFPQQPLLAIQGAVRFTRNPGTSDPKPQAKQQKGARRNRLTDPKGPLLDQGKKRGWGRQTRPDVEDIQPGRWSICRRWRCALRGRRSRQVRQLCSVNRDLDRRRFQRDIFLRVRIEVGKFNRWQAIDRFCGDEGKGKGFNGAQAKIIQRLGFFRGLVSTPSLRIGQGRRLDTIEITQSLDFDLHADRVACSCFVRLGRSCQSEITHCS